MAFVSVIWIWLRWRGAMRNENKNICEMQTPDESLWNCATTECAVHCVGHNNWFQSWISILILFSFTWIFFFFFFSLKTVEVMKILFQKELNSARMILHCMASGQSSLNMSKLLHSHSQCDNFPKHDQKKKRRKNAEMKRTNWTESYWNMENSCSNAQCSSKLKSEYSGNVPQRNKTSNTIITTLQCSNGWISLVYSHIENKYIGMFAI